MTTTTHHEISALSAAIEARDTGGILAWYADDATIAILDRDHPPAAPARYAGATQIGEYFREVCGRNIEHEVSDLVITDAGLAFTQRCRYPDGAGVVCAAVATLQDGRIKNQTVVQVWDS